MKGIGGRQGKAVVVCFVLGLAALALYLPALSNGFVDYDDDVYVTHNRHLTGGFSRENIAWAFTGAGYAANWHPLTWLSHMLDARLFGLDPRGHHLVNVLLHAVNGALLCLVLRSYTGLLWPSALAAALFLVHPLHVEPVAWVAERKEVLSSLFWILAMGAYLGYLRRPGRARYLLLAALFALGLMAKPMVITFPLVLLLLDGWPLGRGPAGSGGPGTSGGVRWSLIREKAPLIMLTLPSAWLTLHAQREGKALASLEIVPLFERLANIPPAYTGYIGKMLWPSNLSPFYPLDPGGVAWWRLGVSLSLLAALTWAVFKLRRRHPYLGTGWFWYLVTLVPVIGLVQVGSQSMADRYTYLPLTGLFLAAAWGERDLAGNRRPVGTVLGGLAAAVLLALSLATSRQIGHWHDSLGLFEHAVGVTRDNWLMHNRLGAVMAGLGRREEAEAHFREVLRIRPDYAAAHANLGRLLAEKGSLDEAIVRFNEALRLDQANPKTQHDLGLVLSGTGRTREGTARFREALRLFPEYPEAHYNLAVNLILGGEEEEARRHLEEAIRLKPGYAEARANLRLLMGRSGGGAGTLDGSRGATPAEPGLLGAPGGLGRPH